MLQKWVADSLTVIVYFVGNYGNNGWLKGWNTFSFLWFLSLSLTFANGFVAYLFCVGVCFLTYSCVLHLCARMSGCCACAHHHATHCSALRVSASSIGVPLTFKQGTFFPGHLGNTSACWFSFCRPAVDRRTEFGPNDFLSLSTSLSCLLIAPQPGPSRPPSPAIQSTSSPSPFRNSEWPETWKACWCLSTPAVFPSQVLVFVKLKKKNSPSFSKCRNFHDKFLL